MDLRTRGARLAYARKRAGLSQSEAAEALGLPVSTFGSYERAQKGGRDFKYEQAKKFAQRFGVDAMWLFANEGPPPTNLSDGAKAKTGRKRQVTQPPPSTSSVPMRGLSTTRVVGYVGASSGEGALYGFAHDQFDEIDRPPYANEKTVAVEIKGKSFGPLMEGMLVFYDDVRRPVTDDLIGSICVIGLADNRIVLKKITRGPEGSFRLLSNNTQEPPIEDAEIEWAAKMIAIGPRF